MVRNEHTSYNRIDQYATGLRSRPIRINALKKKLDLEWYSQSFSVDGSTGRKSTPLFLPLPNLPHR